MRTPKIDEVNIKMVVGTGFEPVKAKPAGLQPAPFDRFGILPAGGGESSGRARW